MASLELGNKEMELNLATVKQRTRQVKNFGSENEGDQIFQWRLVEVIENLKGKFFTSGAFLLNHSNLKAQLNMTFTNYRAFKLSLNLMDLKKDETTNTFNHHQCFACRLKLSFLYRLELCEAWFFALDAFNLNADKNPFNFTFYNYLFDVLTITVELYQEPLAMIEYRSPDKNAVVGKIDKFEEMMEETDYNGFQFLSPRFDFGSPDQLMIAKFKPSNFLGMSTVGDGLSANLRILSSSQNEARGPPFSFTATFTIFSQQVGVKDLVNKVFYARDGYKSNFCALLAFNHELHGAYLDNDTLYYKVHIEPQPLQ